jgi:hypothetical protein
VTSSYCWMRGVPKARSVGRTASDLYTRKKGEYPVAELTWVSYGPPWAHYLGGYQDRLLGGPLGLPGLCHTTPDGMRRKDYGGEVLE